MNVWVLFDDAIDNVGLFGLIAYIAARPVHLLSGIAKMCGAMGGLLVQPRQRLS
jgi:hypothetical protein